MSQQTLFEKVWHNHIVVRETVENPAVLYIDLHLTHEVTTPQAFDVLRERGIGVRRPDRIFATMDHSTPTLPPGPDGRRPYGSAAAREQVEKLEANCREFGIDLHGWGDAQRGIVHVAGPEAGRVHPGMTIVCGDSHTATHGAFGALAFGIGTTEVGHVLATQCLLQRRPKSMAVNVIGSLQKGVSAKDLILAIIAQIGVHGGTGHVIEYRGEAIQELSMAGRMTVCNMSIEAGARAGMIAPDQTTIDWLRTQTPLGDRDDFEDMARRWLSLASDAGAHFDREVEIDAATIEPMATYGVTPAMGTFISGAVPSGDGDDLDDALGYMGIEAGVPMSEIPIDKVFVGSCTNGRLEDIAVVADILRGRHVASGVTMLVVPGSEETKRRAEERGLDKIVLAAGAEWREPGCSMCLAMNGDSAAPGETVVSTSNRNFKGRQGPGARTILASPATAAASAIAGHLADPRRLEAGHAK